MTLEPPRETPRLERLTTEDHIPQRQLPTAGRHTIGLGKLVERRRRLVQHRHLLANQQLPERFRDLDVK